MDTLLIIWPGFLIGLFGSLHCIGMCGPIVLALTDAESGRMQYIVGRTLYNLGRTVTYGLLGAVVGLIGATVAMAGFQRYLSITMGVLILIAVFLPHRFTAWLLSPNVFQVFGGKLKKLWFKLIGRKTFGSLFLIGILNGFLPCGLVYAALAGAATTGSVLGGTGFMVLFGLGTIPVMLAVAIAGNLVQHKIKRAMSKLLPAAAVVLALLLIVRGLSLGIPYLSPKVAVHQTEDGTEQVDMECCH